MTKPLMLVVDDEAPILGILDRLGGQAGFQVVQCLGGQAALDALTRHQAQLAMVDLRMPDVSGLDVVRRIRETAPDCQVVLMTGYAAIETAVEAIKLGATDYLTKPLDFDRVTRILDTVREETERRRRVLAAEREVAGSLTFSGMIGRSPAMQESFSLIRRLAPHVRVVLITGETGTGKELAAQAFHQLGPRRERRFAIVNCSAVVETLFESELFGHVRGAFTGATEHKTGLFEHANGGTLFLDEVGELPSSVQAKLLRVLEKGEVQRVGSVTPVRVDVHIVAATNRDLRAEIAAGRFRSDLLYRLNVAELRLPPLRARHEDIPYLTGSFVREFAEQFKKRIVGVSPSAERRLSTASWPGNVRELRNALERACMLCEGEFITERDLTQSLDEPTGAPLFSEPAATGAPDQAPPSMALSAAEREHVLRVLERTGGNKKVAAEELGISRRALYRLIERHELDSMIKKRAAKQP